jgi:DNA-binding transcriptional LysR family regulator
MESGMQWHERVGRRLKLRDLNTLVAVVNRGSMAKAASELAMSQPAVSKAISDLEIALGTRLLDRSARGVEPTAYGRALVRRSLVIFDELRQGVHELKTLADPTIGELRIGSSETMTAGLLPATIDRLSQSHSGIVFNVSQALFTSAHYRDLRERSIDLLLGRVFKPLEEDDLNVEPLFDDEMVIVAARRSHLFRRPKLALADLGEQRWVLPPADTPAAPLAADIFRTNGLSVPQAPVTTLSIHLALKLAASGRFVALIPSSVMRFSKNASVEILPVKLPVQHRTVGVITLKNRLLNPIADVFIKAAREVLTDARVGLRGVALR